MTDNKFLDLGEKKGLKNGLNRDYTYEKIHFKKQYGK